MAKQRNFFVRTADEADDSILEAIAGRERELSGYDLNEDNYADMMSEFSDLPAEWPQHLQAFRVKFSEDLAKALTGDDLALAQRLLFRDQLRVLMATNAFESSKSEAVYKSLLNRLPDGQRRAAAIARRNAKQQQG